MNLYISPSGVPHVTLENGGKRYQLWPLLEKLQRLAEKAPRNPAELAADHAADEGKSTIQEKPVIFGSSAGSPVMPTVSVNSTVPERTVTPQVTVYDIDGSPIAGGAQ